MITNKVIMFSAEHIAEELVTEGLIDETSSAEATSLATELLKSKLESQMSTYENMVTEVKDELTTLYSLSEEQLAQFEELYTAESVMQETYTEEELVEMFSEQDTFASESVYGFASNSIRFCSAYNSSSCCW